MANFSDDFSGSLAEWTNHDGTWSIVTGQLRNTAEGGTYGGTVASMIYYDGQTFEEAEVGVTIEDEDGSEEVRALIMLRGTFDSNGYTGYIIWVFPNTGTIRLHAVTNNTAGAAIDTYSHGSSLWGLPLNVIMTSGTNPTFEIEVSGSSVDTFVDIDDTFTAAGHVGLGKTGGGGLLLAFDDFSITDLDAAPAADQFPFIGGGVGARFIAA